MTLDELLGGPFDTVLDVGGNVGDFAELAVQLWPEAIVISFEPVPHVAAVNDRRSDGRWMTVVAACSDREGAAEIRYCVNQHSASTMERPGTARADLFGIRDAWDSVEIETVRLERYRYLQASGRMLVKVDAEGHELAVLAGAGAVLERAAAVVCEVQNDPAVFGTVTAGPVDQLLSAHGLRFAGVLDVLHAPGDGRVLQFDGVWRRT